MGMTIEEHIAQLKKLKSFHNGSYGASVRVAIDTMRKYEKIEQIFDDWHNGKINNFICCLNIDEVLNNGDDD